jgi:chromate reductase
MTSSHSYPIRLLGISGSLRRASNNTAVLHSLATLVAGKAELVVHPLNDIPLYDGDLDTQTPPAAVRALKQAIAEADGIVVCSPEYNYGMSGVLKNAIDWASRPGFKSPLKGKPVLVMTSSPGAVGGARAHCQIREAFSATLSRVVARPQVTIAGVAQKLVDGRLVDEPTKQFIIEAVDDLIAEIRRLHGGVGTSSVPSSLSCSVVRGTGPADHCRLRRTAAFGR